MGGRDEEEERGREEGKVGGVRSEAGGSYK